MGSPLSRHRRCACCWGRANSKDGPSLPRAGTISASMPIWPMAAAIAAAGSPVTARRRPGLCASRDYNPLNGGIERWFEPVTEVIGRHPVMAAILGTSYELFDRMTPAEHRPLAWHVELHQFRIEARSGEAGRPTPEGLHRDGVDWVLVLMVRRENIKSGETTIYDLARRPLGSFTLTRPLDAAFVDDSRVYHGVTPVEPLDGAAPAYRDVLVVTYRRE